MNEWLDRRQHEHSHLSIIQFVNWNVQCLLLYSLSTLVCLLAPGELNKNEVKTKIMSWKTLKGSIMYASHFNGFTYSSMVPVVRALMIHWRSRVLKGISTRLVLLSRSMALSGYMTWWVVLEPTSSSKPAVGAWFILWGQIGVIVIIIPIIYKGVIVRLYVIHPMFCCCVLHDSGTCKKQLLSLIWERNELVKMALLFGRCLARRARRPNYYVWQYSVRTEQ